MLKNKIVLEILQRLEVALNFLESSLLQPPDFPAYFEITKNHWQIAAGKSSRKMTGMCHFDL